MKPYWRWQSEVLRCPFGRYAISPKRRVQPPREFRQVMAGDGRIEMVFQVVRQLQEQPWNDQAAKRARLR